MHLMLMKAKTIAMTICSLTEVALPAPRKRVAAKIVHATRSKISTAEIQAPLKEKPGDAVEAAAHGRRKQQKSKARTAFQSPAMAAESSGVEAASAAGNKAFFSLKDFI